MRSEEDGKNFIVDYVTKREDLCKYYKDNNRINFNINVDSKTLKKIKQAEKRASDIAKGIKNSEENQKKSKRINPAINQIALNIPNQMGGLGMQFGGPSMGPIGLGMMPPNALLGQNKGGMQSSMISGMNPGMIPQMGGMINISPQMVGETNPKTKLDQTIRDKDKFLKM